VVRLSEEHCDAGVLRQFEVTRHLASLVEGEGAPELLRNPLEEPGKAGEHACCVVSLREPSEQVVAAHGSTSVTTAERPPWPMMRSPSPTDLTRSGCDLTSQADQVELPERARLPRRLGCRHPPSPAGRPLAPRA